MERSYATWRRGVSTQLVLALLWAGLVTCLPRPQPDSSDSDTPTGDNTLEMLVITPRASQLPSIVVVSGGGGRRGGTTGDDLVNYYLPVIMAEMAAPVSTRDPSIIRVSCRQGFMEDLVGGCRPVFDPTPYFPHNTRPNRHTSVASILPVIRSPPRVTRPEPQTQRDLIRQFNISRGRPAWFGRSLSYLKDTTNSKGPSDSTGRPLIPLPVTTTTTTPSPDTSTSDCDD